MLAPMPDPLTPPPSRLPPLALSDAWVAALPTDRRSALCVGALVEVVTGRWVRITDVINGSGGAKFFAEPQDPPPPKS